MAALPIALSAGPLTRPAVVEAQRLLTERGLMVRVFAADGAGGRALEAAVLAGEIGAVLELSLTELAAEMLGLPGGAGPDRLTAAALRGVPQVIVLGELDAVRVDVSRPGHRCAEFDASTYLRTTPEENDRLGREIANKTSAARGSTTVVFPRHGLSALDIESGPFWWPDADATLFQSFHSWVSPSVRAQEWDLHVNESEFIARVLEELAALMG